MSYQKQNFANGEVLTASQLNHIEDGIVDVESAANATKSVVDKIIDPTLSVEGKAADAKATGDVIGELKEDLNDLEKELIDDGIINELNFFLIGYGNIDSTGALNNGTGTNFQLYAVNVEGRTSIIASEANVYGYFASKPSIGSMATDETRHFSGEVKPFTINIPTGVNYVVIRVDTGTVPIFYTGQPLLTDRVVALENEVENIDGKVDSAVREEYSGSVDVLDDGTVTTDYYLLMDGNEIGPYVGIWEFITFDVNEGDKYSVTAYAGQFARLWLLLDNKDQVVSYSQDDSLVNMKSEVVTIPRGVTKMVVNANTESNREDSISVIELTKVIKVIPDAISSNILAGKVLCCAGDSITYGADMDATGVSNISNVDVYQSDGNGSFTKVNANFLKSWGYQIAERNGMTFYNAGVSGSTMQGISNKSGFSLENGRYTKLPDAIDYLVLWFGWNDTAYGTLGTIDDATNESYYGGYNVVLPYLINKYPYAKIALIVPFGTDAGHRNAIRQLGNKWGVAVWDNYQGGTPLYYGKEESVGVDASIVTANRAKFQANGAHPNYKGHTQLADMIEEFLRGI